MLALKIDDPIIEENLNKRFNSSQQLKKYITHLIIQDIQNKKEEMSNHKKESIFGILQATKTVSLEQMDKAIQSRGHF